MALVSSNISLMNLTNLINPENDKSFDYLTKHFNYISLDKLAIKYNVEDLQRKEKIYHDMIRNPNEYKITRMNAWSEYINWIYKLFNQKDVRYFLILENFTKSTGGETKMYKNIEYGKFWGTYSEMCQDTKEIIKYMKRNQISTKCAYFYHYTSVLLEREHDFISANNNFLEGLEKKVDDIEQLQEYYKDFENRMEGRIKREVKMSVISSEEINNHIQIEIKNKNEVLNKEIINTNNKRIKSSHNDPFKTNFIIKKKKFQYYDNNTKVTNTAMSNEGINSLQYDNFPIFVDEPFRKNVISKGTELVEIHSILMKFLIENDQQFTIQEDEFNKNLISHKSKLPFSWLNSMRIIPDKMMPTETLSNLHIDNKNSNINSENVESKTEEIVIKMQNDLRRKKEEIVQNKKKVEEKITNLQNLPIILINEDKTITPTITNVSQHPPIQNETITNDNEMKYRIVKVETIKKEIQMMLDPSKMIDEESQQYQTLDQIRAKFYFKQLELKKIQSMKNKRKTIVVKVDSDGDYCMDSDEEVNKTQSKESKMPNNNIHVHNNINLNNKHISNNQINDFNLFNETLTAEQLIDKLKQVDFSYQSGHINEETRDLIFSDLEKKIIQLEKLENEKKNKINQNGPIQSFSQITSKNSIISTNPNNNPFLNGVVNNNKPKENNFSIYLEPNLELKTNLNNLNQPKPKSILLNNRPLVELPVHKTVEATPFSNVSRSLDFTNIKIMESNNKNDNFNKSPKPLSSIFINENPINNKNQFFQEISFDSEHSHLFQNISNSQNKEEELFYDTFPIGNKRDSMDLYRTFNVKDTPQLLKKSFTEDEQKIQINNFNNKKKYTDFNDILNSKEDSQNESEQERKEKLSKLFGDAFGKTKKQENVTNPFGMSSILEKATDNTYLSDDSFIFKK